MGGRKSLPLRSKAPVGFDGPFQRVLYSVLAAAVLTEPRSEFGPVCTPAAPEWARSAAKVEAFLAEAQARGSRKRPAAGSGGLGAGQPQLFLPVYLNLDHGHKEAREVGVQAASC